MSDGDSAVDRLTGASKAAEVVAREADLESVIGRIESDRWDERLVGLMAAQPIVERGSAEVALLDCAERAMDDPDEDCRWQGGILAGLFIVREPDRIWDIVAKFGVSADGETRTIVATVLLEHLLDYAGERYGPLADAAARESECFRRTLAMVW